jgi:hypothetical protein
MDTNSIHQKLLSKSKRDSKKRIKKGIITQILLHARIRSTPEYFDGVITEYIKNQKSLPEVLRDVEVVRAQSAINSIWEFRLAKFEVYGKIGHITLNQINDTYCLVKVRSMDGSGSLPDKKTSEKIYFESINFLKDFSGYLKLIYSQDFQVVDEKIYIQKDRNRKKPGRPHFTEDLWVHEKIKLNPEDRIKTYEEWLQKLSNGGRILEDPRRQFLKIINPDWKKDLNDEI